MIRADHDAVRLRVQRSILRDGFERVRAMRRGPQRGTRAGVQEPARDFSGLGCLERDIARGDRNAMTREDGFGLIFVNFHGLTVRKRIGKGERSYPAVLSCVKRNDERSLGSSSTSSSKCRPTLPLARKID